MCPDDPGRDITGLLRDWCRGESSALDEVVTWTYDLLRLLAARVMAGERRDHSLQATELVHEAWQRLSAPGKRPVLRSREHFYRIAARVMRRVLVDHARRRNAQRRGGASTRCDLTIATKIQSDRTGRGAGRDGHPIEILDLDEALDRLERIDERRARVVELHCFTGLTLSETARALGVGEATVYRDWRLARAYLRSILEDEA